MKRKIFILGLIVVLAISGCGNRQKDDQVLVSVTTEIPATSASEEQDSEDSLTYMQNLLDTGFVFPQGWHQVPEEVLYATYADDGSEKGSNPLKIVGASNKTDDGSIGDYDGIYLTSEALEAEFVLENYLSEFASRLSGAGMDLQADGQQTMEVFGHTFNHIDFDHTGDQGASSFRYLFTVKEGELITIACIVRSDAGKEAIELFLEQ